MSAKFETYPLEELPGETSSVISYYDNKKNNDIPTEETNNKKSSAIKFKPFIGILCTFFHALCIQIGSAIAKKVTYISVCQLSLIRYVGIFVGSLPLAVWCNNQILGDKRNRRLLLLRAFISITALILQVAAYRYLQLVQASIVTSTLPLVTALAARILLKERFGVIQTISLIITVCAVLLSIRLPEVLFIKNNNLRFDVHHLIGYAAAIGYILFMALGTVGIRKLKETHFSIIMLYSGVVGIVETATVNASFFSFVIADCGWDNFLYIIQAITNFTGFMLMILAIQHEPAGLFAIQKSSFELLVITVFQIIFFHKYPDWYATAGACLVLISLAIIGTQNWVQMMPEKSEKRKKFKWFLL